VGYEWFKLYTHGWLRGSIRIQLTDRERSVWLDLLAMAAESKIRGTVCAGPGVAYTREYLAETLRVSLDILNSTIDKCSRDKNKDDNNYRLAIDEHGCLVINNFDYYQGAVGDRVRESPKERELRERRQLSQLMRKYPEEARLETTEKIVVDGASGEVLKRETRLKDRVRVKKKGKV
jgi:hypothetical protein